MFVATRQLLLSVRALINGPGSTDKWVWHEEGEYLEVEFEETHCCCGVGDPGIHRLPRRLILETSHRFRMAPTLRRALSSTQRRVPLPTTSCSRFPTLASIRGWVLARSPINRRPMVEHHRDDRQAVSGFCTAGAGGGDMLVANWVRVTTSPTVARSAPARTPSRSRYGRGAERSRPWLYRASVTLGSGARNLRDDAGRSGNAGWRRRASQRPQRLSAARPMTGVRRGK